MGRPKMGHSDGVVQPPSRQSEINFDNTTCAGMISVSRSRGHPPQFNIGGRSMRQRITLVALVAVLALGLAGCGGKEKEELRQRVANLEHRLAQAPRRAVGLSRGES